MPAKNTNKSIRDKNRQTIMIALFNNQKGIALITAFFVLVALLGLSALSFNRTIISARLTQKRHDALQALYVAESGVAYAYAEADAHGFDWFTHDDKNTPRGTAPSLLMPGASLDAEGNYRVAGKNFQVKSFREVDSFGNPTDVMIFFSQATVNGIIRTIEYRLYQTSAYKYFFFFPDNHNFWGANVYDGRNYGGIHVNGNIEFGYDPEFKFLTELTSGSNNPDEGYILRTYRFKFPTLETWPRDANGNTPYQSTPTNPFSIPYEAMYNLNYHFLTGNAKFTTGAVNSPNAVIELPDYLKGAGAYVEYDKYQGDPNDANDNLPLHFLIEDNDLKNLATYELSNGAGTLALLNNSGTITVGTYTGSEQQVFTDMYNAAEADQTLWDDLWAQWKTNHENDYLSWNDPALGADNWQRRFYRALYERTGTTGCPKNFNPEWWENLVYGNDRSSGDMQPAEVLDDNTGLGFNPQRYYLNTQGQAEAFRDWLSQPDPLQPQVRLDQKGLNQTLIQDKSQGGEYLDPGSILEESSSYNRLKDKAKNGGIYIGLDDSGTQFLNPLSSFTQEIEFHNTHHQAKDPANPNRYAPSNILEIDVNLLREWIAQEKINDPTYVFNGVIYVDIPGSFGSATWAGNTWNYDPDSSGVMLTNGERLPDEGLSLVSPNNIFIKGNYNLDPTGDGTINRAPDDANVIQRVVGSKDYIATSNDLQFRPAEVITRRAVYTLSDDFPQPSYSPMNTVYQYQYQHEQDGQFYYGGTRYVSGDKNYPTDSWVPDVAATRAAKVNVDDWFTYYYPDSPPTNWDAAWVEANWSSSAVYPIDTNNDDTPEFYIQGRDLIQDTKEHIQQIYTNTFNFTAIHGADGTLNPDTPSLTNCVTDKYIYNTAVFSPYEPSGYELEYWQDTSNPPVKTERTINGAFIELPNTADYQSPIPATSSYSSYTHAPPTSYVNYESRFSELLPNPQRPATGLIFAEEYSWREIDNANF